MPVAFEGLPLKIASPNPPAPASNAAQNAVGTIVNGDRAQADFLLLLGEMLTLPEQAAPLSTLPGMTASRMTALPGLESTGFEGTDDEGDDATSEELLDLEKFIAGLCSVPIQPPPAGNAGADVEAANSSIASLGDSTSRASQNIAADVLARVVMESSDDAAAPPIDNVVTNTSGAQVQLLAPHHQVSTNPGVLLHHELRAPVGSQAWTDQLGDHLTWMAQNNRDVASLRLTPEHLGPLEVRLTVADGETSVWFGAAHAETRSALEQSLPRLRELFASQGLVLADAGVFRDAPRDPAKPGAFVNAGGAENSDEPANVKSVALTHNGLVDTYV